MELLGWYFSTRQLGLLWPKVYIRVRWPLQTKPSTTNRFPFVWMFARESISFCTNILRANIENVVEILCGSGQLVSGRAPSGVSARIYIFGPSECIWSVPLFLLVDIFATYPASIIILIHQCCFRDLVSILIVMSYYPSSFGTLAHLNLA